MADETLIIEIKADTVGLIPTIDLLEKLGKIDAKTAEEFRKATVAFQAQDKQLGASKKTFQQVGAEAEKAGKKVSESAKKTSGDLSDLSVTVKGIAAAVGIGLGTAALKAFGDEAVKAFAEAEKASRALSFTLTEVLGASAQEVGTLTQQADELSNTTFFSRAQVQQAQNVFAQFGANAEQTRKLIEVTKELAATPSFDNNIVAASQAVVDAIKGRGTALKELGINLKSNTTESEKLAEVTDKLAKLDGTLAEALDTTDGKLLSQKKRVDDLKEAIGEQLAPVLLSIKESFLEAFVPPKAAREADEFIKKIKKSIQDDLADDTVEDLIKKRERIEAARKQLFIDFEKGITEQAGGVLTTTVLKASQIQLDKINQLIEARKKSEQQVKEEGELTFDVHGKSIKQLEIEIELIKKRGNANTVDARSAISLRENQIEVLKKLSEKQLEQELKDANEVTKAQAELRKFTLQSLLDNIEQEQTALQMQAAQTITDTERLQGRLTIIEFEGLQKRIDTKREFGESTVDEEKRINDLIIKNTIAFNEAIEKQNQDAQERRLSGVRDIQESIDAVIKSESDLSKKSFAELLQIIKIGREAGIKGLDDVKAAQDEIRQRFTQIIDSLVSIASEASQIFANIAQERINGLEEINAKQQEAFDAESESLKEKLDRDLITQAQYENGLSALKKQRTADEKKIEAEIKRIKREQAESDKVFSIFEITLSTARAVMAALGSTPPNPILAALVAALGAVQLAKVITTPIPKFAKGVEVLKGKGTAASDEIPAMLSAGEGIMPADINKEYRAALSAIYNRKIPASMINSFVRMKLDGMPQPSKDSPVQFPDTISKQGMKDIWKKGIVIRNPDDIASAIINALPKENPRRRI